MPQHRAQERAGVTAPFLRGRIIAIGDQSAGQLFDIKGVRDLRERIPARGLPFEGVENDVPSTAIVEALEKPRVGVCEYRSIAARDRGAQQLAITLKCMDSSLRGMAMPARVSNAGDDLLRHALRRCHRAPSATSTPRLYVSRASGRIPRANNFAHPTATIVRAAVTITGFMGQSQSRSNRLSRRRPVPCGSHEHRSDLNPRNAANRCARLAVRADSDWP